MRKKPCSSNKKIKSITRMAFVEDVTAILNARRIFIDSGVTRNITIAYELYQKVLTEENAEPEETKQPPCPECGGDNMVRKNRCGHFEGHEFCKDCDYSKFF